MQMEAVFSDQSVDIGPSTGCSFSEFYSGIDSLSIEALSFPGTLFLLPEAQDRRMKTQLVQLGKEKITSSATAITAMQM